MRARTYSFVLAGLMLVFLAACDQPRQASGPSYHDLPGDNAKPVFSFAVHPLHNPNRLFERYQPLIDRLNSQLPDARIVLEASHDYQDFERKFRARQPAFILPNPWQTLEAMKVGYRVQAMAGDANDFKGIFIVRRDSAIRAPTDLKGKAVSYPSPTALAACIMPQYWLHKKGIDVRKDIENHYVGSQESSIMNVYLGATAAGATWPPPWRAFPKEHPREAAELIQVWETDYLLNNSVMARDDVPERLVGQVREILLKLADTPGGTAILNQIETARFHPADDKTYAAVRDFVDRFERDVRPVEAP